MVAVAIVALRMLARRFRVEPLGPAPEPDEYVPMAAWLPEMDTYRYGTTVRAR